MNTTIRGAASAAFLVLLLACSGSASAIPEPGPSRPSTHASDAHKNCPLERIGAKLVRCDDLTGAGAQAPSQVPVQGSR
jgi:hypothetical protein